MILNNVATMYKDLQYPSRINHPVLPLITVCSLPTPSSSSLASLDFALATPRALTLQTLVSVDQASTLFDSLHLGQQTSLTVPRVAHLLKHHILCPIPSIRRNLSPQSPGK